MNKLVFGATVISVMRLATVSLAQEKDSWLFVLSGSEGSATESILIVSETDGQVFGFTDRPNRKSAYVSTKDFANLWTSNNELSKDAPNAVLTYVVDGAPNEVEIELISASSTGSTISFEFIPLNGDVQDKFGEYSIFVDDVNILSGNKCHNCISINF